MTIAELFAKVDRLHPNQYGTEDKTRWLNEIEGKVNDEIINAAEGNDEEFVPYIYDQDQDRELLAPDRFCALYIYYIAAMCDHTDMEVEAYNNDAAMHQAAYDEFAAWYRRKILPKTSRVIRGW